MGGDEKIREIVSNNREREEVNPSTPQHKCWGLPSARAQAEGSGLTLSGALHPALKGGAWRRRMGQCKRLEG